MFRLDSSGKSFLTSASMAFLTSACIAAGSSSFRWPVTPMRMRYGIDSKSAICLPMSYILYHSDHGAGDENRAIEPNGCRGHSRARLQLRFKRRSYCGYHRRDEELVDAPCT